MKQTTPLAKDLSRDGQKPRRLIIGMSGATGAIYGVRFLQVLKSAPDVESHLVMSKAAERTIAYETEFTIAQVRSMADASYSIADIGATISSGSFHTEGMIIAPCSMKTLAAVANSLSIDLLGRSADVVLKERRPLVLMVREAPLHLGHLRLMVQAAEIGAIIVPPVPAFYNFPKTLDDVVNHTVGRILDLFRIDVDIVRRWEGMQSTSRSGVPSP
jgi:4-hydroxy-3-polyprenylbenzoate decarboxylase